MAKTVKILAIGDIVGPGGIKYLRENLRSIQKKENISMTIANGENAAIGNGLDKKSAYEIYNSGVDVITSGNHIWKKREIYQLLDDDKNIIRPSNYPAGVPGNGYTIYETSKGCRVLVMNVMGRVYMDALDDPFISVQKILDLQKGRYDISFLDIHAEATSEKIALGRYFDGKITGIFGTHTHVQTADERVLPGGTGYITDLGMTGPVDSVLGIKKDIIIDRFLNHLPRKFEFAEGEMMINGAVFEVDIEAKKTYFVSRIRQ